MGKIKFVDGIPYTTSRDNVFRLFNYESVNDNGYSWRIIANWDFRRETDFSNLQSVIKFASMYAGRKNYWVEARLEEGKVIISNPRNVKIPNYAINVVSDMLQQIKR